MDRMEPFGGAASFLIADLLDQPDESVMPFSHRRIAPLGICDMEQKNEWRKNMVV